MNFSLIVSNRIWSNFQKTVKHCQLLYKYMIILNYDCEGLAHNTWNNTQ